MENYIFLIPQPKHMLWVLKRTAPMRRLFSGPTYLFKLMGKTTMTLLCKKLLNWPYEYAWENPSE